MSIDEAASGERVQSAMPIASDARESRSGPRPLNLSRWFALVGLLSIAGISAVAGYLLSIFVTDRMVRQEGELTMEMVQNLVLVEKPFLNMFAESEPARREDAAEAIEHIASIPGVLRANVYDRSRRILWSSDQELIGQLFGVNDELDDALRGELVAHGQRHDGGAHDKAEHRDLAQPANFFVEIYLPVRDRQSGAVVGAIEVYKNPVALFNALQHLYRYIAVGAALSGLFLYAALFWLVRRADLLIREQQRRLLDAETLAVIGEMSSAVAHGIRNPLASIRSSAELMLLTEDSTTAEAAADIVAESDRLEAWVRELLSYSRPLNEKLTAVELEPLVRRCIDEFARELQRRDIDVELRLPDVLPAVRGDPLLLGQVMHSVVANAIEAIGNGGRLEVACDVERGGRQVLLVVRDNGPGMPPNLLQRAGKPFFTTKPRGLGVGLALARRIVERFGGALAIESSPGDGTTVKVVMAAA
ncbi:histidine kinase [Azoarcus sp. KH32C]|nr:histidine kinase [Azoarcus sp. KH32C]